MKLFRAKLQCWSIKEHIEKDELLLLISDSFCETGSSFIQLKNLNFVIIDCYEVEFLEEVK